MAYKDRVIAQSAAEMFHSCNLGELKSLAKVAAELLAEGPFDHSGIPDKLPTRKDDLAQVLIKTVPSEAALRRIYSRLGKLEQAAVQEAVFSPDEVLDWTRFRAKYGDIPDFSMKSCSYGRAQKAPPLRLLMSSGSYIPADLKKQLAAFVPRPREVELQAAGQLPAMVELGDKESPLAQCLTEEAALHDVTAVLHLADAGSIGASDRTGMVSDAGAGAIRKVLLHGDFYPEGLEAEDEYDVQMGAVGIRPFAWPLILQAGGLAKPAGGKLRLTRAGQIALERPPHEVLKALWERWLEYDGFHELSRVEAVKGQKSKGHPLTSAEPCREDLADALAETKAGVWVSTEAFFKFLIAGGHRFNAVRNAWALYIGDRQYGSFGYNHVTWEHLNGRFARAFLLEYAATLGIIDVALTPPWGATRDLGDCWGTDCMSCLSRYDGLRYLRVNALGAWIVDAAESYRSAAAGTDPLFKVLPNLEVAVTSPALSPADRLFLERICDKASDRVWRLSRPKLLKVLEDGIQEDAPRKFLEARSGETLSQTVAAFFDDALKRAARLRDAGAARLVRCTDAQTAALIASDARLKEFCLPAGETHVVVFGGKENAFRRMVRELGYGVLAK